MSQKWLDAARRYRQAEERQPKALISQLEVQARAEIWRLWAAKIADAARDLEQFVHSEEGHAARALLGAARRHIIFGEEREGGYADVSFIDVAGLQKSYEPHGTWTIYAKPGELPKPKIMPMAARDAVQDFVLYTKKKPWEVLPWLRSELDKIADAVR